jgi:bifunctional ADP-heptose synthase (sugar kinase/adenylyltransferase)
MNLVEKMLSVCTDTKLPHRRILVIGDGMTDVYVHGHLAPCQDGCQKFVELSQVVVPGGAKNAARSLTEWLVQIDCPIRHAVEPVKTRFMVDGKIHFRHDSDRRHSVDSGKVHKRVLLALVDRPDGVLISDYDKGTLSPELIRYVAEHCERRSIPCVADCKRAPKVYAGCILKCNNAYWIESLRAQPIPAETSALVVTRGAEPPLFWETDKRTQTGNPNGPPVSCVNHVGAGDCFAAHLTLALACGLSLKEAATVAHSAGRVYVQHPHNRPPHPAAISADLAASSQSLASPRESTP